jgi:septation ring formation regulator EzrA
LSRQNDLENLGRIIKNGEIRIRTININIDSITKDINKLSEVESELMDNIRFLKQTKIVAMAGEYKRAKEDLARTVIRLVTLINDRENFKKAIKNVEELMAKSQIEIDKIIEEGNKNVLRGTFGRKKDGKE